MYTFAERLKELREERNLNQHELSKALDCRISYSAISHWETGIRIPKMDALIMLADYFGVSIDYLVGRED